MLGRHRTKDEPMKADKDSKKGKRDSRTSTTEKGRGKASRTGRTYRKPREGGMFAERPDTVRPDRPNTGGRPKAYTPEELADKFDLYIYWAESNPLQGCKVINDGEIIYYPIRRPLTLEGFARFAGVIRKTLYNYAEREEFAEVIDTIRDTIRADQLEAALANLSNPTIAARVLNLREGADITSGGEPIKAGPQAINLMYNGESTTITADDLE